MTYPNDQWIGVYYPLEIIANPRSRSQMFLLFDKVICFVPIAGTMCGGGAGISDFIYANDVMVESGILEVREELLVPEIDSQFDSKNLDDNEIFDEYVRFQITAMTMAECNSSKAVPVTDDPAWPVPASLLQNLDLKRFARLQATALAVQSLEIVVPPFAEIKDEDILEAREKLYDQLLPFRQAMLALSPVVRNGISCGNSLSEIQHEAKYIVDTHVVPALGKLHDRLNKEKGKFWRRIIYKGAAFIPQFVLNWTTKGALSSVIDAVENSKDIAMDLIDRDSLIDSLRIEGGLGYLLALSEHQTHRGQK